MASTGPPGCAAVTGWAGRGCAGLAPRRGVPATESRAHDARQTAAARGDRAGRSLRRSGHGRPARVATAGPGSGRVESDGPGQLGPGLPRPERRAGAGERQRAAAPNRGRNAGDSGQQRPGPGRADLHRQSQTRTDSGRPAPTEPGPGEGAGGAGRDRAPRCRPGTGPRRTRSGEGEAGDPPHGSLSGRGTGAGRRVSDVQRCRQSLFCGEGLGIGRADCGPDRRCSAGDLRRRRPDRDGGLGSWHNGPGTPARGLKRRGRPGHVFRCFRLRRRRRCARCCPRPGWGRWGGVGRGWRDCLHLSLPGRQSKQRPVLLALKKAIHLRQKLCFGPLSARDLIQHHGPHEKPPARLPFARRQAFPRADARNPGADPRPLLLQFPYPLCWLCSWHRPSRRRSPRVADTKRAGPAPRRVATRSSRVPGRPRGCSRRGRCCPGTGPHGRRFRWRIV